jgi:hypothetical protein
MRSASVIYTCFLKPPALLALRAATSCQHKKAAKRIACPDGINEVSAF